MKTRELRIEISLRELIWVWLHQKTIKHVKI